MVGVLPDHQHDEPLIQSGLTYCTMCHLLYEKQKPIYYSSTAYLVVTQPHIHHVCISGERFKVGFPNNSRSQPHVQHMNTKAATG